MSPFKSRIPEKPFRASASAARISPSLLSLDVRRMRAMMSSILSLALFCSIDELSQFKTGNTKKCMQRYGSAIGPSQMIVARPHRITRPLPSSLRNAHFRRLGQGLPRLSTRVGDNGFNPADCHADSRQAFPLEAGNCPQPLAEHFASTNVDCNGLQPIAAPVTWCTVCTPPLFLSAT